MSPLILKILTATIISDSVFSFFFFFFDDFEKKIKRRLQKIYGQNELKSKIKLMSRQALFEKEATKGSTNRQLVLPNDFCREPGYGKNHGCSLRGR